MACIFGAFIHSGSFANTEVVEVFIILPVFAIIAYGAWVTFFDKLITKSQNNEINNSNNSIRRFSNFEILLPTNIPFFESIKSKTIVVLENKFGKNKEKDPLSKLKKLLDKHNLILKLMDRYLY